MSTLREQFEIDSQLSSRVYDFAESYADMYTVHVRRVVKKAYLEGYDQCIEDIQEGNLDLDDWQRRLSRSYSDLKVKYHDLKCKIKEEKEDKHKQYLELKKEFDEKEEQ